jgi:hypothetical protein
MKKFEYEYRYSSESTWLQGDVTVEIKDLYVKYLSDVQICAEYVYFKYKTDSNEKIIRIKLCSELLKSIREQA